MFRENVATIKNVNIFILHTATVVDLVANASFIFVEGEGETFRLWVLHNCKPIPILVVEKQLVQSHSNEFIGMGLH